MLFPEDASALVLLPRIIPIMRTRAAVEELLLHRPLPDAFPSTVVLPDYAGYSLVGIPSLVMHLLGVSSPPSPLAGAIDVPPFDRVVLLILDGLGYRKLLRAFGNHGDMTLQRLGERGAFLPITSVFPATTVTALTSYGTGLTPQQHGMIGYRLYLHETQSITNMIHLSILEDGRNGSALNEELTANALLPVTTVYEQLSRNNVTSHSLLPHHIAGTGLSQLLYRGCSHSHPVVNFADMLVTARQILETSCDKTFLTLYWPGLDSIAHTRGPETDSYLAELLSVDAAIGRELLGRVDRTLLVVSSDHGFVPMRPTDYVALSDLPSLSDALLLPPVGEPRASYFHLRHRSETLQFDDLPGGLLRLAADQALELGLLGHGKQHPELAHRLGDLIIASTGPAAIYHPYPDAQLLPGMHGGLTIDEMLIPLIVSPL